MEKNEKYRLGLDIGIASVGWGIVNENNEIVDAGVRLFPEASGDNLSRRTRRGARRLLRRRNHRLERLKELLVKYRIISDLEYNFYSCETTPYHLRVKGLSDKLSDDELGIALFNLIKRRGIQNFSLDSSSDNEEKSTKGILSENKKELAGRYPCELQLERLKLTGSLRGIENIFKTDDYKEEAQAILKKQKEFNKKIDDRFIDEYLDILTGRRTYYEGPGEDSIYGWEDEDEWMNKLVGNCTYYPEELRMVKHSPTAEFFNLLNDLNNLRIKREGNQRLTRDEKEKIIKLFKKNKTVSLKKIAATLDKVAESDITGYRIDSKDNPEFTKLETYIDLSKLVGKEDVDLLDEIGRIATYYQDVETRKKYYEKLFSKNNINLDNESFEKLLAIKYSGTHSLSKKAMMEIMEDLLDSGKNQMELFTERGLVPYKMNFKGMTNIPKVYLDEWILSPVVKRSLGQCINVVNAIIKKYGMPEEIVIEMARDKNSDEQKRRIEDMQKNNRKFNEKILKLLGDQKLDRRYFNMLRYWDRQDGQCIYSGEKISIQDIINNPQAYEVDHIIPRSISFDDSQNNKVFVKRSENQKKGQRTPYSYFKSGMAEENYEDFKKRVLDMYKNKHISLQKRDNLLFEGELGKHTADFIARNLVDTRYATREFANLLKRFFKDNNHKVKIKAIRGSFTSQIRKQWSLTKMRDISHVHHAQDALIILVAEKILNELKWVKQYNENNENIKYHISTGEIIDDEKFKELFNYEYGKKIAQYNGYKFSHFIDKKPNRQFSDETLYSTRKYNLNGKEVEYIIGKISNIYDEKNKDIDKFFGKKEKQKQLLVYHNDPKTFEKLLSIYNEYKGKKGVKNPFYEHFKEYGYITKYSSKNNGPIIKTLKYRVKQVGECIDLTHKYETTNKRVVLLTVKPYRMDMYYNGEQYKFITIKYVMLKDKGKYYEMDMNIYNRLKEKKGITDDYKFQFSLFKGDFLEIIDKDGKCEKNKFKGVLDDDGNTIEVDFIDKNYAVHMAKLQELDKVMKQNPEFKINESMSLLFGKELSEKESRELLKQHVKVSKQKRITIGKKIKKITKINTDVLGNEYIGEEKCNLIIAK